MNGDFSFQVSETERHSSGVTVVVNMCDVLLSDHDACPTATERRAALEQHCSREETQVCKVAYYRSLYYLFILKYFDIYINLLWH